MNEKRAEMLVEPQWLADHLTDPQLRILDCTTYMIPQPVGPSRIESGRPDYEQAHIPGAQHVDMCDDLSDPDGAHPYTLPEPRQIERLLGGLGINEDHRIILYGRKSVLPVARAWFVLRAMGHRRIALLDGSFEYWQSLGLPVTKELPVFPAEQYRAQPDSQRVADMDEIRETIAHPECLLVNALTPEQFRGTGGAHYGRPGRIPGSVNIPARDLVNPNTMAFQSTERIRALLEESGAMGAPRVVTYCGGGIAASVTAFALEMLQHPDWALYDNSLLEWSSRQDTPMDAG
ncbi:MAG: sulfurtransferase [Ectothiorhodospiraceae bacterium]|nr:sulfurtransferase [Ectothiorhodospiraceae bacterium]MCH8506288.1 sulfurtransferase [Ectothiorhodospiraceae bacterium]